MPAHFYLTGFRESDLDLERRVLAFLEQRQVPLADVKIAVRAGAVILRGSVRSRRDRSLVADASRRVAGVGSVIDMLHVAEATSPTWHMRRAIGAFQPI